ncbi:MAG: 2-amino-4-hydroxy-6-hydroxymethyldihydropteridine diphosphokinase [Bacteroidota bacterium]
MKTFNVFLGLGSNLGERHKFLQQAANELKNLPTSKVIWTSSVYETDPYGKPNQPKFLNACVEMETTLPPAELYLKVKEIEQRVGRMESEQWGPREIDIDILVYDGLVFSDETLNVPHAEMENRRFVLVPLREIAPDLVHPTNGMTVEKLSASCKDTGKVIKTSFRIFL